MKIIFENRNVVAAEKPVGVDAENEMIALLKEALPGEFYCVHRLDKAVGGAILYARNQKSAAALSCAIQENKLKKEYLCVSTGHFEASSGEMKDFLFKDSKKGKSFPVDKKRNGVKEARLFYDVISETEVKSAPVTLCHVLLDTGRYHQIRAQFAARKHPLLGDGKYGSRDKGCTTALWSTKITFQEPVTGEEIIVQAIPPDAFPWNLFDPKTN